MVVGGGSTGCGAGGSGFGGGGGTSMNPGFQGGGSVGGLGYMNNYTVTPGSSYIAYVPNCGRSGAAIRIVWPGSTRQFPSTCVASP